MHIATIEDIDCNVVTLTSENENTLRYVVTAYVIDLINETNACLDASVDTIIVANNRMTLAELFAAIDDSFCHLVVTFNDERYEAVSSC